MENKILKFGFTLALALNLMANEAYSKSLMCNGLCSGGGWISTDENFGLARFSDGYNDPLGLFEELLRDLDIEKLSQGEMVSRLGWKWSKKCAWSGDKEFMCPKEEVDLEYAAHPEMVSVWKDPFKRRKVLITFSGKENSGTWAFNLDVVDLLSKNSANTQFVLECALNQN